MFYERASAPPVLAITDQGGDGAYRTLTNGMAQALREIEAAEGISLNGTPIVYRDSLQVYDGVLYDEREPHIYHIGGTGRYISDEAEAVDAVLKRPDIWAAKKQKEG